MEDGALLTWGLRCARRRLTDSGKQNREYGFACSDLEAALRDAPGDTAVLSAFAEAKKKYDPRVRPGAGFQKVGVSGYDYGYD